MTAAAEASAAATGHRFTRHGHESPLTVFAVDDRPELGHILVFGRPADGCLVRIHSRCLYGEALDSQDCDCGPELRKSLDLIQEAGDGVLVYLEQEGRGAGLIAKALGYREAERTGTDTFTAYRNLGYPEDARSYAHAAAGLRKLGLTRVRLLTNNPDKVAALRAADIAVTPEPLYTPPLSERAAAYLEAKRRHRGHWIPASEPVQVPARGADRTPEQQAAGTLR
ncbi:GTP cyclohydrolase II [Nocardia carnea]|uniref:GTP cyclohydrolase II n=1 Tax=Nocardia carnea TaxID=37328 RepID=UPI0024550A9D|nr:GTP cyclohydrolase II [Nocardia carnea]